MSSAPSIFVPCDILKKADQLIRCGGGSSVREGVELLLKNDLSFESPEACQRPNAADAGSILQHGLTALANAPHAALDVPIGAKTIEIRKAYKKMALKYHPDKNPKTTALFQAIQTASDKLTDPVSRREAESQSRNAPHPQETHSVPKPNKAANPRYSDFETRQNSHQSSSHHNHNNQQQSSQNTQSSKQKSTFEKYTYEGYKKYEYEGFQRPNGDSRDSSNDRKSQPNMNQSNASSRTESVPKQFSFQEAQKNAQARERERERLKSEKKAESEERLRDLNAKRAAEYKSWCENESKFQKDREDKAAKELKAKLEREKMMRDGERAYFEEVNRLKEKEKHKAGGGMGAGIFGHNGSKAKSNVKPSATPDEVPLNQKMPESYAESQMKSKASGGGDPVGSKHFRSESVPLPNSSTSSSSSSSTTNTSGSSSRPVKPTQHANAGPAVGRSFTVSSDGNVKMHDPTAPSVSSAHHARHARHKSEGAVSIPRPAGLKYTSLATTSVELSWDIPFHTLSSGSLSVEFSWRNIQFGGIEWETSSMLISGSKVLKKNLSPGCKYEFRVRCVFTEVGGSGKRGAWSDVFEVQTQRGISDISSKPTQVTKNNNKDKDVHAKSNGQNSYHDNARGPPYQTFLDEEDGIPDHSDYYPPEEDTTRTNSYGANAPGDVDKDTMMSSSAKFAWPSNHHKEGDDNTPFLPRHAGHESPPPEEISSSEEEDTEYIKPTKKDAKKRSKAEKDAPIIAEEEEAGSVELEYALIPPDNSRDYRHNVYENQSVYSAVIGFLIPGIGVEVHENTSDKPEWIYVRYHRAKTNKWTSSLNGRVSEWGWSLRVNTRHVFLVPDSSTSFRVKGRGEGGREEGGGGGGGGGVQPEYSNDEEEIVIEEDIATGRKSYIDEEIGVDEVVSDDEEDGDDGDDEFDAFLKSKWKPNQSAADLWHQMLDENGYPYYYNESTGESSWEAPEWVEEVDNQSGARYYVKLDKSSGDPLNSTWSKPQTFSRILRGQHS